MTDQAVFEVWVWVVGVALITGFVGVPLLVFGSEKVDPNGRGSQERPPPYPCSRLREFNPDRAEEMVVEYERWMRERVSRDPEVRSLDPDEQEAVMDALGEHNQLMEQITRPAGWSGL